MHSAVSASPLLGRGRGEAPPLASFSSLFGSGAMQVARCLQSPLLGRGGGEAPLLLCFTSTLRRYCFYFWHSDLLQSSAKFCKVLQSSFCKPLYVKTLRFSAFSGRCRAEKPQRGIGMPVQFSLSPTSAGALTESVRNSLTRGIRALCVCATRVYAHIPRC